MDRMVTRFLGSEANAKGYQIFFLCVCTGLVEIYANILSQMEYKNLSPLGKKSILASV